MADCTLCALRHPGGWEVCPELRTDETILGKYTIGKLLGVGGMAAVYEARHTVLRRDVALKVLHKRFAEDAELGSRFVREARETAGMGHPAFVGVYDAGVTEDGCAFIEMDRLAGRDLHSICDTEGALAIDRVCAIATAVLDGLAVLHARGVVHRDLKSSNIFLCPTPDGREVVKLIDLGFAKVDDDLRLTSRDTILGTPFYISPEQYLDPTSVDGRADLFSLGIVMFESLTATWPYSYTTKQDLLKKVMTGELERHPRSRRPEIPAWLDIVVVRALAKERDKRFASAEAMRAAIGDADAPPPADPPARERRPSFIKRLFGG